ncbi:glycoside hydrolase family 113 [Bythopirellula goksoeyrii]|uniref:Glycosyl hydrolase family 53 n=1 Tax=Bythopirellula goksoeyrii TaxID=1400387 RepID=A0A5B9QIM7_9BACT|nr:glycosyl hydrolase family 53 [Bythopirellula goksoeyrii]QEG33993.1 hypothetical protein Pr1d_12640 [Bythopirellula goksoeyrii]
MRNSFMPTLGWAARVCLTILILCCSIRVDAQENRDPSTLGFLKGYTWGWDGYRGAYASKHAKNSMKKMADMGCDWVCISFATTMRSYDDPEFNWSKKNPYMVSDEEIRTAIAMARELGLKVILKPVVNSRDSIWRAWIRFYRPVTEEEKSEGIHGEYDPWGDEPGMREGMVRDEKQWDVWWKNFAGFLEHYAKIAEDEQVELFCLGCEMNSTEEDVERWNKVIEDIREIYSGFLTYNANHGRESELAWWSAVDVISTSAYYPVPPPTDESLEEAIKQTTSKADIVATLNIVKRELAEISSKFQKPILFIETGVTSVRGAARYPWSHPDANMESPVDMEEQSNYYQGMLEVFWDEPWFMGFTWWDWPARLYSESDAADSRGFCIYGKSAEKVLRDWYAKPASARTTP